MSFKINLERHFVKRSVYIKTISGFKRKLIVHLNPEAMKKVLTSIVSLFVLIFFILTYVFTTDSAS